MLVNLSKIVRMSFLEECVRSLMYMLPREWRMCIPCVRVSLNPMTGVIICSAPRNVVLGAL